MTSWLQEATTAGTQASILTWNSALGALAALVGSSIGAYVAHRLYLRREQREREGQRAAETVVVLRVLHHEIYRNQLALDRFAEDPHQLRAARLPPEANLWDESKWKVAQLIGGDLYGDLVVYYFRIKGLSRILEEPQPPQESERYTADIEHLKRHVEETRQQGEQLLRIIRPRIITGEPTEPAVPSSEQTNPPT